jgi:hypothetical protein
MAQFHRQISVLAEASIRQRRVCYERKKVMSLIPYFYISNHAIEQFQQRIALLEEVKARRFIMAGLRQATNVKVLPSGNTLRLRTRRRFPFEFRAYCVFD